MSIRSWCGRMTEPRGQPDRMTTAIIETDGHTASTFETDDQFRERYVGSAHQQVSKRVQ